VFTVKSAGVDLLLSDCSVDDEEAAAFGVAKRNLPPAPRDPALTPSALDMEARGMKAVGARLKEDSKSQNNTKFTMNWNLTAKFELKP
jgi:hypothetical protein